MYNRYISEEIKDTPIPDFDTSRQGKFPFKQKEILTGWLKQPLKNFWQEEGRDPLDGLLRTINLEGVDSGDILLVLLILFLLIEGDDQWELIITLGLLLIMGLAERDEKVSPDSLS